MVDENFDRSDYPTSTGKPEDKGLPEDKGKPWWVFALVGVVILVAIILFGSMFKSWANPVGPGTVILNGSNSVDRFGLPPWLSVYNATNSSWECPYDPSSGQFVQYSFNRTLMDPISGKPVYNAVTGQPRVETVACSVPVGGFAKVWRDYKGFVIVMFLVLLIVLIVWKKKGGDDEGGLDDKLYDLWEAQDEAAELLKSKGYDDFKPTSKMVARTDLGSYRYVFEEMNLPEINDHQPYGNRAGKKRYALIELDYNARPLVFDPENTDIHRAEDFVKPGDARQNNREYRAVMNKDKKSEESLRGSSSGSYPPSLREDYLPRRPYYPSRRRWRY